MIVRALAPADVGAMRALVEGQFAGTRYLARLLEQIVDPEYRGFVASEGTALAVVLYGEVGGASCVMKVHALIGDDGGALRAANSEFGIAFAEARLVVCELPDDSVFTAAADVLLESGFVEESRAEGLVAEGIALRFLVRRRDAPTG